MSEPFPPNPYLSGNFAPILMECDAPDLPIVGKLPKTLSGTLYRNGPNPQFAPRDNQYHWFLGDGMVHAFRFEEGRVSYRNRWVRTKKFAYERAAGRALYGSWGNPATTDPSVADKESGGVANTNIVWHAERLLALEEAHLPVELDRDSLKTEGYCDFAGKLAGGHVTAHPKIDPVTGEMVFFAYSADGPLTRAMRYGVIDRHGKLLRFDRFEAPYASMVHDFMVTRNHVIFPILPLTGSMERATQGKPAYAWEPERGAYLGVMRRDGAVADIRWFSGDPCYAFHPMNAWEEGDRLFVDIMQYEAAPLFPLPDGTPGDPAKAEAHLSRWSLDLAGNSNRFRSERLDDLPGEFPRIDDRFAMAPHRHGYYTANVDGAKQDNALAHFDRLAGRRTLYTLPEGDVISEPVFVPRAADAAEGDGWLLATVYRGAEKRSDLVVFDAASLGDGPIATAQLSHRVPFGFHGNWRAAA